MQVSRDRLRDRCRALWRRQSRSQLIYLAALRYLCVLMQGRENWGLLVRKKHVARKDQNIFNLPSPGACFWRIMPPVNRNPAGIAFVS